MLDEIIKSKTRNTQCVEWNIPISPKEGVFRQRIGQCVEWENGVQWSWNFRSMDFELFPKWVLSFKAIQKLEPTDLKSRVLNLGFYYYYARVDWNNGDSITYLVKTYLEIVDECQKGEDYSCKY